MKNRLVYGYLLSSAVLALLCCTNDSIVDTGGASETVAVVTIEKNTLSGKVFPGRESFGEVSVRIFSSEYSSLASPLGNVFGTETGDTLELGLDSGFTIELTKGKYYNLFILQGDTSGLCLSSIHSSDTLFRISRKLSETADVRGAVFLDSGLSQEVTTAYRVAVLGSDYHTKTEADGSFTLERIPPGFYRCIALNDSLVLDNSINDSIKLKSVYETLPLLNVVSGSILGVKGRGQ